MLDVERRSGRQRKLPVKIRGVHRFEEPGRASRCSKPDAGRPDVGLGESTGNLPVSSCMKFDKAHAGIWPHLYTKGERGGISKHPPLRGRYTYGYRTKTLFFSGESGGARTRMNAKRRNDPE